MDDNTKARCVEVWLSKMPHDKKVALFDKTAGDTEYMEAFNYICRLTDVDEHCKNQVKSRDAMESKLNNLIAKKNGSISLLMTVILKMIAKRPKSKSILEKYGIKLGRADNQPTLILPS